MSTNDSSSCGEGDDGSASVSHPINDGVGAMQAPFCVASSLILPFEVSLEHSSDRFAEILAALPVRAPNLNLWFSSATTAGVLVEVGRELNRGLFRVDRS